MLSAMMPPMTNSGATTAMGMAQIIMEVPHTDVATDGDAGAPMALNVNDNLVDTGTHL